MLRYEKRTNVYAASMRSQRDTITVKEEVIDDALEALAFLRERPEIDAQQHVLIAAGLKVTWSNTLLPGVKDS